MSIPFDPSVAEHDPEHLLLIVTGSGLEAEAADRASAYDLAEEVRRRLPHEDSRRVLVVSDLWYVNQPAVRRSATLAIGRPEINAASALLARRVPTAMVADGRFRIQFDVEGVDRRGCLYGTNAETTREAIRIFVDRHLDAWLTAG